MPRTEEQSESAEPLSGVHKAAVLLLALDEDASSALLKALPAESVEEVTRELAGMDQVDDGVRNQVLHEYYDMAVAKSWSREGGLDSAQALLYRSLDRGEAERIMGQIKTQVRKTPFAFLQKAESANLLTFIQDEHPQTIALIVSHLAHHKASEILGGLAQAKQLEVVKRVANMDQTSPEVIDEVERGLEARLANMLGQSSENVGGVESVAEMLNLIDRTTEKGIMEGLESDEPELVEEIRRLMFVFEDIRMVDGKGIQAVLKEIENDQLAVALKTASDELKELVFANMSQRAADMIREEMEFMGPVRVSDVEQAQQKIVDVVRRLEDEGEIIISGRGGDKEMVV